ncbi:hypothetical protein PHMEG_00021624 [Phytophthora megakarya]|uniref:Uncharacterized protein n=1 Tax=Phytophthora megakarya TaxID=4795 RepID=A0A225VN22_9STRA|nr:hypothetical protein PHMEG_00021624 [Phytophthora megakarya]
MFHPTYPVTYAVSCSLRRPRERERLRLLREPKIRHHLEENPDTAEGAQGVKKRHCSSKVCAVQGQAAQVHETNMLCNAVNACATFDAMKERILASQPGTATGTTGMIFPLFLLQEHKTGGRPPASGPGKKSARRQQARQDEDVNSEDNAKPTGGF